MMNQRSSEFASRIAENINRNITKKLSETEERNFSILTAARRRAEVSKRFFDYYSTMYVDLGTTDVTCSSFFRFTSKRSSS